MGAHAAPREARQQRPDCTTPGCPLCTPTGCNCGACRTRKGLPVGMPQHVKPAREGHLVTCGPFCAITHCRTCGNPTLHGEKACSLHTR